MTREIHYFLLAVMFFTRIPVPRRVDYSEQHLNHAARYFPAVGWLVGAFGAGVFWLADQALTVELAVALSMAATLLLTGAFHEDGIADTCDGFGGGRRKEEVLSIMKDSRIGTFGAVGLIAVLGLKFLSLSSLPAALVPAVLVSGHGISRLLAISLVYTHRYAGDGPASKSKPLAVRMTGRELAVAALFGLLPLILLPPGLWAAAIPAVLAVWVAGRYFEARIGGYTGDCLGAAQQATEVVFYLALVGLALA